MIGLKSLRFQLISLASTWLSVYCLRRNLTCYSSYTYGSYGYTTASGSGQSDIYRQFQKLQVLNYINLIQLIFIILLLRFATMENKGIKQAISACYKNSQLIDLITEQVLQLQLEPSAVKPLDKYVMIVFDVPDNNRNQNSSQHGQQNKEYKNYDFQVESHKLQFILLLGQGYPVAAPRLFTKTCILSPGFDDCRNLLYQVMRIQQWDHKTRLKSIRQQIIKSFLPRIASIRSPDIYQIARIGGFVLNSNFPIQLIKQIRGQIFFAFQYDQSNKNALKMLIIDVSSTHICIFLTEQQPHFVDKELKIHNEKDVSSCALVFYAQLGSIIQLDVNRANFNDIQIKFQSKKPQNMHMSSPILTKRLKMRKGSAFLKKLLQQMKNYPLIDIKLQTHPELVGKQQKLNLELVSHAEKQLEHKFNAKTVETLNECYQKMIEYYESNNIPYYQVYVQKITKLYQRPDVQLIMDTHDNFAEIKDQINID